MKAKEMYARINNSLDMLQTDAVKYVTKTQQDTVRIYLKIVAIIVGFHQITSEVLVLSFLHKEVNTYYNLYKP